MANRSAIGRVLARIKAEDPKRFVYASIFTDRVKYDEAYRAGWRGVLLGSMSFLDSMSVDFDLAERDCNTAACVAGWACLVERPSMHVGEGTCHAAQRALGLDDETADLLFYRCCEKATRDDAIARLTHLFYNGTFDGYQWDEESYAKET